MDNPVSMPRTRGSIVIRSVAVAALLLALISGTVYAQASSRLAQDATPAVSGGSLPTAAAAPVDTTAFVAINVDPNSEQFQTSAELSQTSGLTDLFGFVTDFSASDQNDITSVFDGVGATEIGVAIPAVSTSQLDAVSTVENGDVPAVEDQDIRIALATTDPAAAFKYLTNDFPDLAAGSGASNEKSEYAGVQIVSIADSASPPTTLNFALVEDLIVVAPTVEGVQSSIDAVQGTTEDITSSPRFQDVASQLDGDSMLFAYSDSTALFSDPAYTDLLTEMGIDPTTLGQYNVHAGLRVAADASAPGFRVNTVSFPDSADGATPTAVPSFSSDLTGRVPDSTMIYLGGNDLGQLLGPIVSVALAASATTDLATQVETGTPEVVTQEVSDGTPAANGSDAGDGATDQAEATPASGDDLAAISEVVGSFLTLLNGEYVVAVDAPQITALGDPNSLFVLFVSGVEAPALVDSLLGPAADAFLTPDSGVTVTSEVIDGNTIYTATTGTDASAIRFSYGVVDGQLLVGLGDSVQSYLSGPNVSLADDPQFQQTFEALGRSPSEGAVVYLDLTTLLPLIQTGGELLGGTSSFPDADPACGDYDTQADAQAAYDEQPFDNSSLDQDGDGQACDDYFPSSATPEPVLSDLDLSAAVAYGQVTYQGDGFTASDGLFLLDTEQ